MEEGKYKIYRLIDPRDDSVHYVGLTTNPKHRLNIHMYSKSGNKQKDAWIQEVRQSGLKPIMEIVDSRDDETEARQLEARYVAQELLNRSPITNV